jgi:hypothetical protein
MRKALIGFVALVLLFSCASIREYQKVYRQELQQRDNELFGPPNASPSLLTYNDSSLDLLLGLYAFSIIKNPDKYPFYLYQPYLFSPFNSFSNLMVYESMLQSINRMETFKLSFEIQRILDELKREAAKIKD